MNRGAQIFFYFSFLSGCHESIWNNNRYERHEGLSDRQWRKKKKRESKQTGWDWCWWSARQHLKYSITECHSLAGSKSPTPADWTGLRGEKEQSMAENRGKRGRKREREEENDAKSERKRRLLKNRNFAQEKQRKRAGWQKSWKKSNLEALKNERRKRIVSNFCLECLNLLQHQNFLSCFLIVCEQ